MKKILAQLGHFRKKAPYYHKVNAFFEDAFEQNLETITDLNAHLLRKTCEYIGLDFEFEILSEILPGVLSSSSCSSVSPQLSREIMASRAIAHFLKYQIVRGWHR